MEYLKKEEIIFGQKPEPDYSGIPEWEESERTTSTEHVFRGLSEHNQKVDNLKHVARLKNFDKIDQMQADAQKEGKTIVWYCCDFAKGILEGAIRQGIRRDDFLHSFVPSFVDKENHAAWKNEFENHQHSGYTCEGKYFYFLDASYVPKTKENVKHHLERLETDTIRLYYLESLTNDIQNAKEVEAFGGGDKYNREIQPLNLWLENEAEVIRAKLSVAATPNAPTLNVKAERKEPLPKFEDAFKEPNKLPALWERLSEMEEPFVTENGSIIGGKKARKHREVMALAQILTPLMKEGNRQFDVYSMLCKKVGLTESSRSARLPSKAGYDDIRLSILAAVRTVLK